MYDIEKMRMDKMKEFLNLTQNFSQKHESSIFNSGKTFRSNFSNTVLSQRKKKLLHMTSKDARNMKKKSLFVRRSDLNLRFDVKKRNSHQIDLNSNTLSAFTFNKDILENHDDAGIADKIFESIKKNSFRLEKLREEKAEDINSSDISDEPFSSNEKYNQGFFEDDDCSIDSKELEPEYEIEEEDLEPCTDDPKEIVIMTLIKERNALYGYKNSNANINVLGYFKSGTNNNFSHNQRKIPFDESEYNYAYLILENKLLFNRIYHGSSGVALLHNADMGSKISEFEPSTESRVHICEFEEKTNSDETSHFSEITHTVKIANHPVAYATHLDSNNSKAITTYCLHTNQTQLPNYPNKLDFIFDHQIASHFKARVVEGCYSCFVNLDQNKFKDRLILEEGTFFMVSEKRGFYVSLIASEKERNKKRDFIKKHVSPDKIEFCAINFDYTKAYMFYHHLMGSDIANSDGLLKETEMDQFKSKYHAFCLDYVNNHDVPLICINTVEYLFDYRIYRTVKKCILFQVNTLSDFFTATNDEHFTIKFGAGLHKAMKTARLQNLHSVAAFNFPYDIALGYKHELGKFYLLYSNFSNKPSEYFYFQDERLDRHLEFKVNDKTEENEFKEGLWLSLAKYVEFCDSFTTGEYYVILPYGCLMMFYKNVFRVTKKSMHMVNN